MFYAIKVEITDTAVEDFSLARQKTMYGGKRVAAGDPIYIFASEGQGGQGLIAKGVVTSAETVPKARDIERQTPRVTIRVKLAKRATKKLGRSELKPFDRWDDGRPETELNFKFYRQATNKVVGISDEAAAFLEQYFD